MTGRGTLRAVLALSAIAIACDSPAEDPDAGRDAGSATADAGQDSGTPPVDSGTPPVDSGTPPVDSGTPPVDGGESAAPVITRVEWETPLPPACMSGVMSAFTIRVTVTDPDTPAGSLTYSGSVPGCTGSLDMAMSVITCPNAATYTGNVTVMDPDANSHSVSFSFPPCSAGMTEF